MEEERIREGAPNDKVVCPGALGVGLVLLALNQSPEVFGQAPPQDSVTITSAIQAGAPLTIAPYGKWSLDAAKWHEPVIKVTVSEKTLLGKSVVGQPQMPFTAWTDQTGVRWWGYAPNVARPDNFRGTQWGVQKGNTYYVKAEWWAIDAAAHSAWRKAGGQPPGPQPKMIASDEITYIP